MKGFKKNDGMIFENMLNITNEMYDRLGEAVINKRSTPIKVFRTRGNRILDAVYEKKSTVDYDGTIKERSVYFEAKSVLEKTRFPLANIEKHQYEHLEKCHKQGSICFALIFFIPHQAIYLIRFELLDEYWKAAAAGGRKSIPIAELNERAHKFGTAGRAPVDYLPIVKRIWFNQPV